jgi:hypothetical protein
MISHTALFKSRYVIDRITANAPENAERIFCFERFFPGVTPEICARMDAVSDHYIIRCNTTGDAVGGFRLTKIGMGVSEAERLFIDFHFVPEALELGGFWISKAVNDASRGWLVAGEMFRFLRSLGFFTYFKTSELKGLAARRYGVHDMKSSCENPALKYPTHLFMV